MNFTWMKNKVVGDELIKGTRGKEEEEMMDERKVEGGAGKRRW